MTPDFLAHPETPPQDSRPFVRLTYRRDIARPKQFSIAVRRGLRATARTWSLGQRGANSETDPTRVGFCFLGRERPGQLATSDCVALENGGEEDDVHRYVQTDHQH